ncbi:phospholipase D family protein [Thermosulfurimonas dismutans]|uniref:PLD phosphodiesterase domain-containing protein n=1 Tax=Thermosulfurimonas dismutans TaxID=999894 RepID=A0A179D2L4_9BACT|nr:phospholipase D family protein [Thermosulfurimonas dismutans]OAQ20297.1 hypothetical protein TDIS_1652 [Thermosulfurimonas dismutans]
MKFTQTGGQSLIVGFPESARGLAAFFEPEENRRLFEEVSANAQILEKLSKGDYQVLVPFEASHAKIFLLKGETGRRLIWGSANLTERALGGRQWEILEVFDEEENPSKFALFEKVLRHLKKSSRPLFPKDFLQKKKKLPEALLVKDKETLEFFADRIGEVKTLLVEAHLKDSLEEMEKKIKEKEENVREQRKLLEVFRVITKRTESGAILISPREVYAKKEALFRVLKRTVQETREFEDDRPRFQWREEGLFRNGEPLGRELPLERLQTVFQGLNEFLSSYSELTGEERASRIAFEAVLYAFMSPFLWLIRKEASLLGEEYLAEVPIFLYIAGAAGSGKTFLLRAISRLLGNHGLHYHYTPKAKFPAGKINSRGIYLLLTNGNLFPVLVDEVKRQYFTTTSERSYEGVQFIKEMANTFSGPHACFLATGNEKDFHAPPEVMRRIYYLPLSVPFPQRVKREYRLEEDLFRDFVFRLERRFRQKEIFFPEDFLKPAREIFLEYFEELDLDRPRWFTEERLVDLYYRERARRAWFTFYHAHQELFAKTIKIDGREYFDITRAFLEHSRPDKDSLVNYLPSGVVVETKGVVLLDAQRFKNFLDLEDEKKGFRWWKRLTQRLSSG